MFGDTHVGVLRGRKETVGLEKRVGRGEWSRMILGSWTQHGTQRVLWTVMRVLDFSEGNQ